MSSLLSYDTFVHGLAGSVASATAMTVFYPLDTVRSRLQLEPDREAKNTFVTLLELAQKEGLGSLYKGLEPILYSLFTSNFVYFYSFHGLRRMADEKTALKDLAMGSIAGAINVLTTTPLWVVNTRIRMQKDPNSTKKLIGNNKSHKDTASDSDLDERFSCLSDGLIKICKKQGPAALWSGTLPSLVLVSNPAIQFMIFEMLKRQMKQFLDRQELSPYHIFALGAISKSVSTVISYPLQVVQSKRRNGSPEVQNKSMGQILKDLAEQGTLYKGMEAKLVQTVMTTALMFVFYERIYSFVTKVGKSVRA